MSSPRPRTDAGSDAFWMDAIARTWLLIAAFAAVVVAVTLADGSVTGAAGSALAAVGALAARRLAASRAAALRDG